MIRIGRGLAFDAAIPIEVATTTPLGQDPDIIRAGRIGAGLGRPVAMAASKDCFLWRCDRENCGEQDSHRFGIHASGTDARRATGALRNGALHRKPKDGCALVPIDGSSLLHPFTNSSDGR